MMRGMKSCKNSEKKTIDYVCASFYYAFINFFICCFLFFYLLLCCDTGRTRSCRIDIDHTRE